MPMGGVTANAASGPVMVTDDFDRGDADPVDGNWSLVTGSGSLEIVSMEVLPTTINTSSVMVNTGATFPDDQYAQITSTSPSLAGFNYAGVVLRYATGASTGYRVFCGAAGSSDEQCYISLMVAGMNTTLDSVAGALAVGDTLRAEITGTTITAYKNGMAIAGLTATDATVASGRPGMVLFALITAAEASLDDFEAGSLP